MKRELSQNQIKNLLQAEDIGTLTLEQITQFFLEEEDIEKFAPDGVCQLDPRNGDRIVYNSARARRPHDNRISQPAADEIERECFICNGKTTQILDIAELSEGFTFINKNLFPIFYPKCGENKNDNQKELKEDGGNGCRVNGYHFLQWTSSFHDKDWQNMPLGDRIIVMRRLAALEKKLLEENENFVSIIKNYGHLVGGSLVHGHQQIGASSIMPNRFRLNKRYLDEHGETFAEYMLRENSSELAIKDYGPAILLTPYFMRRPYDMFLIMKDCRKAYLHMLSDEEINAAAEGWRDAIRIMLTVMPQIGKETAYNITVNNGPGAGLYFEFLPYTQEMGGFEHLGLYLCQGNPEKAAQHARELLESDLMRRFELEGQNEG